MQKKITIIQIIIIKVPQRNKKGIVFCIFLNSSLFSWFSLVKIMTVSGEWEIIGH